MKERIAVYAGTFDPPTNGHVWMIENGFPYFDELIVAIGINPDKRCMFSVEDRLGMLRELTKGFPGVRVDSYPYWFLVHYAQKCRARFILRGIRNIKDYEYESEMRDINEAADKNITTSFLIPPPEIRKISSSTVRGLVGPERWEEMVRPYVPLIVFQKLKEVYDAKQK